MPSIWLPDARPATAGSLDDEFRDASSGVPSGWTEVDHGGHLVVDEDEIGLQLTQATHAGNSVSGIYKTIPAGDFTIYTKVSLSCLIATDTAYAGLAMWEDATSSTGNVFTFGLRMDLTRGPYIICQTWTQYDDAAPVTFGTLLDLGQTTYPTHLYLRMRRTGTNYSTDVSLTGLGWQTINGGDGAADAISFTPTHVGPFMNNAASGVTVDARFAFFRYVASNEGDNGIMQGDRIEIVNV